MVPCANILLETSLDNPEPVPCLQQSVPLDNFLSSEDSNFQTASSSSSLAESTCLQPNIPTLILSVQHAFANTKQNQNQPEKKEHPETLDILQETLHPSNAHSQPNMRQITSTTYFPDTNSAFLPPNQATNLLRNNDAHPGPSFPSQTNPPPQTPSKSHFPTCVSPGHISVNSLITRPPSPNSISLQQHNKPDSNKFPTRIINAVNDAATCILISIGHQVGLFPVLNRLSDKFRTASEIADATRHLSLRYVKEWLLSMTCVGIIEEHPSSYITNNLPTFRLPPEHAIFLTWGSFTSNMALLAQYIPILGRLEDSLIDCFRTGSGLPVSTWSHFDRVAAHDTMQTIGGSIPYMLALVDGLEQDLENGICVVCVAGTADGIYVRLAKIFPRSWITCYGTSVQQTAYVRKAIDENGVHNLHIKLVKSLLEIEEIGAYDLALLLDGTSLREFGSRQASLKALRKAIRAGRSLLTVEVYGDGCVKKDKGGPVTPFLYSLSTMRNLPQEMFSCDGKDVDGRPWGHVNARKALFDAGFDKVDVDPFEEDGLNVFLNASCVSYE